MCIIISLWLIILLILCYYSIDFVYLMFKIESNMFLLIWFYVYAFILLCSPFVRDVLYNIGFLLKPNDSPLGYNLWVFMVNELYTHTHNLYWWMDPNPCQECSQQLYYLEGFPTLIFSEWEFLCLVCWNREKCAKRSDDYR